MALGPLARKIRFHRRRANRLRRMAMRRHFRATAVARPALKAKQNGHHVRARNLMRRALRIKRWQLGRECAQERTVRMLPDYSRYVLGGTQAAPNSAA
jgi:hypothetical protein